MSPGLDQTFRVADGQSNDLETLSLFSELKDIYIINGWTGQEQPALVDFSLSLFVVCECALTFDVSC